MDMKKFFIRGQKHLCNFCKKNNDQKFLIFNKILEINFYQHKIKIQYKNY